MSLLRLCSSDKLLQAIREQYLATPLRVPEERVVPLTAVASKKKVAHFHGPLAKTVKGLLDLPSPQHSHLAQFSMVETTRMGLGAALPLLSDIFGAFASANVELKSQMQSEISLYFPQGQRDYYDTVTLGTAVRSATLDATNPSNQIFLDKDRGYELLVIDSTLTSRGIGISAHGGHAVELVAQLRTAIGSIAGLNVNPGTESHRLEIQSNRRLCFAFTCVRLLLGDGGEIESIERATPVRVLNATPGAAPAAARRHCLTEEDELFTWDPLGHGE